MTQPVPSETPPRQRLVSFDRVGDRLPGPDLVRALAIGAVIACHAGIFVRSWFGLALLPHLAYLGFHGVTLFFVLSGFLLGTTMLALAERNAPPSAWGVFLLRRWARTLPAYYATLVLLVVPLALDGHGAAPGAPARMWVWYLTITQNLFWPPVSDWFGVCWSLCVEEWFYILFPACFLLIRSCGLGGRRGFVCCTLVFMLVPPCWRALLPGTVRWDLVTSRMAACRFDSIGWGVLAALCWRERGWSGRHAHALLLAGSMLFGLMWWHDRLLPGLNRFGVAWQELTLDVTAFAFACCMPAAMRLRRRKSGVAGAGQRLVGTISTHSYPLYLLHLPLILFAGDLVGAGRLAPATALLFCCVSIPVGTALSWRLVERPVLRRRPRQQGVETHAVAV